MYTKLSMPPKFSNFWHRLVYNILLISLPLWNVYYFPTLISNVICAFILEYSHQRFVSFINLFKRYNFFSFVNPLCCILSSILLISTLIVIFLFGFLCVYFDVLFLLSFSLFSATHLQRCEYF